MAPVEAQSEEVTRRIKQRATLFVIDNLRNPTPMDFVMIENAMMIGALIHGEVEMEFMENE